MIAGALMTAVALTGAAVASASVCAPTQGLAFVCGADRPEDFAHIPGTRWLVVSGFQNGSGLKLVDTEAGTLRSWYTGAADQLRPVKRPGETCPSPPDPASFNVQGISLRAAHDGRYTLYATNHGGRESIELFAVDARPGVEPGLTWTGCVQLPAGVAANSVASFSDGTVLITELTRPGTTIADFVNGAKTGAVYQWRPGTPGFDKIPGTELPGNNGIETSRNDDEFYVVAFGWHAIVTYSRADPSRLARVAAAPGFMPDNVHWDGDRLITGGMQVDEPACGGLRKVIDGKADGMLCHRGYTVAEFEPRSMSYRILAYSEPNVDFNGVSGAVIIGKELWLSSYQADRVAHRTLPWLNASSP
jgi:hypothetical protein